MIKAAVCTIGDEILIGQIVDTNSSMLSRSLGSIGVKVEAMVSIGDSHDEIVGNLSDLLEKYDVVICTGGLGPTKDDITKSALCELFGSGGYVENAVQKEIVRSILHSRGLDVLDSNRLQAYVPEGSEVIPNRKGTAPVIVMRFPAGKVSRHSVLYSMPGVPFETEAAVPDVLDDIKRHFSMDSIYHRTIMTYGIAESALAKKVEKWEDSLPCDVHLAYLPNPVTGVRLRLSIYGGDREQQQERLSTYICELKEILGDYVYSDRDSSLEEEIGHMLRGSGKTLATAESCTGGMIAHLITTVPGSSEYFLGSVISYSPDVKTAMLGVGPDVIREKGIVSEAVATAMANGVRKAIGSTYAVATTGWADSYGDEHEPAGTVWIAVSGPCGTVAERFSYSNDRKRNIERFAASALDFLRRVIRKG